MFRRETNMVVNENPTKETIMFEGIIAIAFAVAALIGEYRLVYSIRNH